MKNKLYKMKWEVIFLAYRDKVKNIQYLTKLAKMVKMRRPDLDDDEIKEKVKWIYSKYFKDMNMDFQGQTVPLTMLDRTIIDNELIVSGSGSLYHTPNQKKNVLRELISELKRSRKIYKKKKFEHMNDEDLSLHDMYDNYQKTIKILNNSFYGVLTQSSSIFFNKFSGPAITYSGEDIVTTSVSAFENFLSNNLFFKNMNDVYSYIVNITDEVYHDYGIKYKQIISDDIIVDNLLSHFNVDDFEPSELERQQLTRLINNLSDDDKMRVYFKNNIFEFFEHTNVLEKYVVDLLGRSDKIDKNQNSKAIDDELEKILKNSTKEFDAMWNVLKQYVLYNYQDFYRFYKAEKGLRKSVLTIN